MAQAQEVINIKYNGGTATVSIPSKIKDVTSDVKGASVVLTSATADAEYVYRVEGKSSDGSLTIKGDYKLTLQLAGVELTNAHGGPAIDVQCGKRIAVELVDGTINRLSDAAGGTHKGALYFKGHAEFEGKGTVFVTGKTKHAISAKEEIELKNTTGTINILGAVSDGIHCGKGNKSKGHNYFRMKGGIVNIQGVGSDGVDSDDYGVIRIEGGSISVNVPVDGTGLKADSLILIKGGSVSLSVAGDDAEGMRSCYATTISGGKIDIVVSGNGSKGIKSKCETDATVQNGGFVNISGGEINMQVTGGDLTKTKEEVVDVDKCMGMSVDADFMQTEGVLSITALGKEARTYNVKGAENRTGGLFDMVKVPWSINVLNYQNDMSAYIAVTRDNQVLTNYTSVAVGAFIDGECAGYAVFPNTNYGIMRIWGNSATNGKAVIFKLYDYDEDKEYDLTSETAVTFADTSCVGDPNTPLALQYMTGATVITPKIVSNNLSREYGEENPQLTYKVTEGELKDEDGVPELTTKAVKNSTVGSYPIIVGKGTLKIQYKSVDGTLTITKAPLAVGVQDVTITEGDAIPTFTLTYSGWKNSDTEATAFTTKPTATTAATATSKAGTYDITVSGGTAKNYELSYKKGKLTILKKDEPEPDYKVGDDITSLATADWEGKTGDYGGLANASVERYTHGTPKDVGDILTQTVSGLRNGTYRVLLEVAASFTPERGFECPTGDGLSVVFANNTQRNLPVLERDWVSEGEQKLVTLTATVTDGTLKYGIKNLALSGNWFVARLKSIVYVASNVQSPKTYTISIASEKNGKTTTDVTADEKDSRVFITTTPDEGCTLESLKVTTTGGKAVELTGNSFIMPASAVTVTATYKAPEQPKLAGDANGDGTVNVFDVTAMVNYILGSPNDGFVFAAADVNNDGIVNVFDVTKVVNIILGVDDSEAKTRKAEGQSGAEKLYIEDFEMEPGEEKEVNILLNNPDAEYRDLQFDLYLPEGITVVQDEDDEFMVDKGDRCTKKHTIGFSYTDGHYVCMLYSTAKNPLSGNSGDILTITLKADGNVAPGAKTGSFRNVSLSKTDATGPTYDEFFFDITVKGADGIEDVIADDREYQIYTLDGKAVNVLQRGVNIIHYSDGTTKKVYIK